MEYLMAHRTHPTVDEIYLALSPSIPTLSKTTVYNTLKLCGRIYDLTPTESDTHPGEMERDGHQIQEIHHYYKGICKQCIAEKRLNIIDN